MRKPFLGAVVGALLGLFDGLSAWAYPEARSMMAAIVTGSTVKGLITGLVSGAIAVRTRSTAVGVVAGVIVGAALSAIAAAGQPNQYWAIVLPGMLVGAITGYVTQRFGRSTADGTSVVLALLLTVAGSVGFAQAEEPAADLSPLKFFIGRWHGTSEGQPGKGTAEREYRLQLRGRAIELTNRVLYPPQAANPKGETHEDLGIFSFDRGAKKIRFRQFHVEGFVVHYAHEAGGKEGTTVFVSDAIENIPGGYRSRETYVILGPDEFEEIFELAEPGKDFAVYSRTTLTRVK